MKDFILLLLFMLLICTVGVSAQSEHRTDTFGFRMIIEGIQLIHPILLNQHKGLTLIITLSEILEFIMYTKMV